MLISTIMCCFYCKRGCSCCTRADKKNTKPGKTKLLNGTEEPYQHSLELLVDTSNSNHHPSVIWNKVESSIKIGAQNAFNDMLNKCVPITFFDYLEYFKQYACFSQNRHSSYCRHPYCANENHAEFTDSCLKIKSKPICYYGVMDWNYLRIQAEGMEGMYVA